jgi:hypothetical protein
MEEIGLRAKIGHLVVQRTSGLVLVWKRLNQGAFRWPPIVDGVMRLIETCKLNGINPQTYIAETLTRLVNGWPQNRIDELMPWQGTPPATP